MLASPIIWFSQFCWGQTPPPAEVIFLTADPVTTVAAQAPSAALPATAKQLPVGTKQIQVYKSVQKNGVVRYSDRAPEQGHYEVLLLMTALPAILAPQ